MRDGYARWAPRYPPRPHNALMEAEGAAIAALLALAAPRCALDVGTGTGRNLQLLRAAGARTVVGLDLSPAMLAHGLAQFPRVCGDAQELPFQSGRFDLVSSSLMCGDVPDPGRWLGEASRVLAAGGHLIYSDFHPSWAASGWQRTFRGDDGREYRLPFHSHAIETHLDRLHEHGLVVRAIREPRAMGRVAPVVVVIHAVKGGRVG